MIFRRTPHDRCQVSDDWHYKGMQTLILENELLRVVVIPDKGSDIVEFRYKPTDTDFLLMMPGGVRNPQHDTPSAPNAGAFLDYFSGGWNEVLPNGGPVVTTAGAEYGQHGEVSLVPWKYAILEDTPERVSVRLSVRAVRTPLYLEKTLTLNAGSAVLQVDETLTNVGGHEVSVMWGQHIAFGRPFLDEGAIIDLPPCQFVAHEAMPGYEPRRFVPEARAPWPLMPTPDGNTEDASVVPAFGTDQKQELAYLMELSDGWYAITNPEKQVGFGLRFDHHLYRYIWYWQQLGNVAEGYPWWGQLHTTALEPWTSYPSSGLNEAIANGSALVLAAGEQVQTQLKAVAYHDIARVAEITPDGAVVARAD